MATLDGARYPPRVRSEVNLLLPVPPYEFFARLRSNSVSASYDCSTLPSRSQRLRLSRRVRSPAARAMEPC